MTKAVRMLVAAAAAAGVVAGGTLGLFGVGASDPVAASLSLDAVPAYLCPGEGVVGSLHRGDRVLVTGRSGDWLAVRNVRGGGERVFVAAAAVVPDADLTGLPEQDCAEAGTAAAGAATTTTTEPGATTTTTTSTTTPGSTTTTGPTTTTVAATTTTAPATTPTAPDTTDPVIQQSSASPSEIWEQDAPNLKCDDKPRQSTISAIVSDDRGVDSVTAAWTDPDGSHTAPMSSVGDTYSITVGPYAAGDWDPASLDPYDHDVTVTITARDEAGNSAAAAVVLTVWEVGECFG